jgi:hypothetical protein
MNLTSALAIAALAASLLLLFQLKQRVFPIVAAVASGIEALLAFRVFHFGIRGLNLWLILGAALIVAGAIVWTKTAGKTHVTAATVVTLVGAVQVFTVLV